MYTLNVKGFTVALPDFPLKLFVNIGEVIFTIGGKIEGRSLLPAYEGEKRMRHTEYEQPVTLKGLVDHRKYALHILDAQIVEQENSDAQIELPLRLKIYNIAGQKIDTKAVFFFLQARGPYHVFRKVNAEIVTRAPAFQFSGAVTLTTADIEHRPS